MFCVCVWVPIGFIGVYVFVASVFHVCVCVGLDTFECVLSSKCAMCAFGFQLSFLVCTFV